MGQAGRSHRTNSSPSRAGGRIMRKRKRMLRELDQDIRDHLEVETQDNLDRGMSPEEARYAALRKFGNVTRIKEETREVWIAVWLEQLIEDVRFGLRMLRKNPGFTAVAVLTLALGIGANTALFSVVNAVLIQPLPFENASRLVWSWGKCKLCDQAAVAPSDFIDYRAQNQSFEYYGAMAGGDSLFNLAGRDNPVQIKGSMVTAGFFDALGIQARYGRIFEPSDEKTTEALV